MTAEWTDRVEEAARLDVRSDAAPVVAEAREDGPISDLSPEDYPMEYRFLEEHHGERPEFVKLVGSRLLFYLFALNMEADRSADRSVNLDRPIRRGLDLIEEGYGGSTAVLAGVLFSDAARRAGINEQRVAEWLDVSPDAMRQARDRLKRWSG